MTQTALIFLFISLATAKTLGLLREADRDDVPRQKAKTIKRQAKYKGLWSDVPIISVDRWYPSLKLCSGCGFKTRRFLSQNGNGDVWSAGRSAIETSCGWEFEEGGLAILADGSTERITPTEFVSDWHYQQEQ